MRLRILLAALAAAILVAAVVFAVVLVAAGSGEARSLTRAEYVARVNTVCRAYNVRLARISAPTAVGNPQAVAESVRQALPLVVERSDKVRAIVPPKAVAKQVGAMFALSDRAIRELRTAYRESRANHLLEGTAALGRFLGFSDRAKQVAAKIGLSC